jgi:transposase
MANTMRDAAKERFWRDVLKRAAASDLSVRAFCQSERLAESAFYAWRRTIAERDAGKTQPTRRVPSPRGPKPHGMPKQPAFLPVVRCPEPLTPPTSGFLLELRGGRTLRLPESIPVERLAELICALEAQEAKR